MHGQLNKDVENKVHMNRDIWIREQDLKPEKEPATCDDRNKHQQKLHKIQKR